MPACPQEVENRRATRARKAEAIAAGHESGAGTAVDGATSAATPRGNNEGDQDEGEEEEGVGPGAAYSPVRRELRKKIISLEDKLQVFSLLRLK